MTDPHVDAPLDPHPAHDPATVTLAYAVNSHDNRIDIAAVVAAGAVEGSPVLLSHGDHLWWRILDGEDVEADGITAPIADGPDSWVLYGWTLLA